MVHVFMAMEGDEGAGEEFGDHLAAREAREDVAVAMLEDEDALQRGALRESEMGFSVPGSAVHVNLGSRIGRVTLVTRVFPDRMLADRMFSNNDAIVAEDVNFVERGPEAGRSALAGAGVTDEQVAGTVRADDADAVELDGTLLGEAVHDQEFVEGIAERLRSVREICEALLAHLKRTLAESVIDRQSCVGIQSQHFGLEVELQLLRGSMKLPGRAGIECLLAGRGRNSISPFNTDIDVGGASVYSKRLQ